MINVFFMDKRSSVAILEDVYAKVLRFKLSRGKFTNGRLEIWKMEVDMKNGKLLWSLIWLTQS